jgi:hypothetical protein
MRRSPLPAFAALGSALLLGCTDHDSPSASSSPIDPSFSVEHGTAEFGFPLGDERYTLIIGHTLEDMTAICEHREPAFRVWDVLTVTRPEGRDDLEASFKQLTMGKDMPITVFEYSPFEFGNECPLLEAPVFEGTGQAFFNDNDVNLTHNGANSFNLRVNGKVVGEDGQRYHVKATLHHVLSKESTLENFVYLHGPDFEITLTPMGR